MVPVEAGVDDASSGGRGGSGGTTTAAGGGLNAGGAGGTGGKTTVADASADSSAPSADSGSDSGELQCAAPTTDSDGQWFDLAASTCKTCPATTPVCGDFLGKGGATYDPGTQVITFHLKPGIDQVLNGKFHTSYAYTNASNITIFGALDDLPVSVSGDTVRVNLSGLLPANTTSLNDGILSLTDACGTLITTYHEADDCLVFSMNQYSTDAGIWKVQCVNFCT